VHFSLGSRTLLSLLFGFVNVLWKEWNSSDISFSMWAEFKESCIFNLGLYHTWKCVLDQEPTWYSSRQMWASFMQILEVSDLIWKIVFSKRDENRHCLNFPVHRVESTTELMFGFSPLHLATFAGIAPNTWTIFSFFRWLVTQIPQLWKHNRFCKLLGI
jgi:hypothetical protein